MTSVLLIYCTASNSPNDSFPTRRSSDLGTRPCPRHRWAVADLLGVDEEALWPEESQQDRADASASEQVQRVYAHRWQVPRERSEEHTSELQSRGHLVCRLLLEKKKTINT